MKNFATIQFISFIASYLGVKLSKTDFAQMQENGALFIKENSRYYISISTKVNKFCDIVRCIHITDKRKKRQFDFLPYIYASMNITSCREFNAYINGKYTAKCITIMECLDYIK